MRKKKPKEEVREITNKFYILESVKIDIKRNRFWSHTGWHRDDLDESIRDMTDHKRKFPGTRFRVSEYTRTNTYYEDQDAERPNGRKDEKQKARE